MKTRPLSTSSAYCPPPIRKTRNRPFLVVPSSFALEGVETFMPILVSNRSIAALERLVTGLAEPFLWTGGCLPVESSYASGSHIGSLKRPSPVSGTSIPYGIITGRVRKEDGCKYGKDRLVCRYFVVANEIVTAIGWGVRL